MGQHLEFSLQSAFSTGGLVGHLAYVLLILSMLMRQMVWLRVLVIASALIGIAYSLFWLQDPVSTFWETLLVTVNVVQLLVTWRQNSRATFSAEERAFAEARLRGLDPAAQRKLLNMGDWVDLPDGTALAMAGHRPDHLSYLVDGRVAITIGRHRIAEALPGSYVGEMSLMDGGVASASARFAGPGRVWRIPISTLQALEQTHPTWTAVLGVGIARDMRAKIVAANDLKLGQERTGSQG